MKISAAILTGYRKRYRDLAIATAAAWGLGFFLWWMLAACAADRVLALPRWVRFLSVSGGTTAPALIVTAALVRLRKVTPVGLAALIEGHENTLQERLLTAASYGATGGESPLLGQLESEIERWSQARVRPRPGRRRLGVALIPSLTAVCLIFVLRHSPAAQLPRLLERFSSPWAALPAVGVMTWEVLPGDTSLPQGIGLRVTAVLSGPADKATLRVSHDGGRTWAGWPMQSGANHTFTGKAPAFDGDVLYSVSAGSITSGIYTASLLRRPGVGEFRVKLIFPVNQRRPPVATTNTDGLIDGPVGAEASVDFLCTEPMAGLTMVRGRERIESRPTGDPRVRRVTVELKKDGRYDLRLRSEAGVSADRRGLQIRIDRDSDWPGMDEAEKAFRARVDRNDRAQVGNTSRPTSRGS